MAAAAAEVVSSRLGDWLPAAAETGMASASAAPGPSSGGAGGEGGGGTKVNQELWYACAGPLVTLPPAGSLVVYFPQGHSEQVPFLPRGDS